MSKFNNAVRDVSLGLRATVPGRRSFQQKSITGLDILLPREQTEEEEQELSLMIDCFKLIFKQKCYKFTFSSFSNMNICCPLCW